MLAGYALAVQLVVALEACNSCMGCMVLEPVEEVAMGKMG